MSEHVLIFEDDPQLVSLIKDGFVKKKLQD